MSPVTLHMEYFGPYRDETVDFNRFSATPLFLISGKTGSGKTTIFDGMCYALFDQTSGGDRTAQAMRSDFATSADQTRVSFTFTHRNRHYEIIREPEQLLDKKRGTGQRNVPASVTLTVFEGDQEITQLTKVKQVKDYLQDLLQMDGRQFAQIVLLPQGQFRRFLVAPSEDKAVVLEQLFNTEVFARWATRLKSKLRENENANRETAATLDRLQSELRWTEDNADQAKVLLANRQTTELLALMAEQQTTTQAASAQVKAQLVTAKTKAAQLIRQDASEEQLVHDQQQLGQQQAQHAQLAKQQADMTQLEQTISELEWVQELQPKWQERQTATAAVGQRQQEQQQATSAVEQANQAYQAAVDQQKQLVPIQKKIDQEKDQLAQQAAVRPVYEKMSELNQRLTQAKQTSQQCTTTLNQTKRAVDANQADQADQQKILATQATVYAEQQKLTQLAGDLREWRHQLAELKTTDQQVTKLTRQVTTQADQTQTAQTTAQEKRAVAEETNQQFLRSQIARLSSQLKDGTPCPVCGATTHPQPAVTAVAEVAEETVKQVQATANAAEKKASEFAATLAQWRKALVEKQDELAEKRATLRKGLNQPATATLQDLNQQVANLVTIYDSDEAANQQKVAAIKAAQQRVEQLTTTATTLVAAQSKADEAKQAAQRNVDRLITQLTTERQRLPEKAATLAEFNEQEQALRDQLNADQKQWQNVVDYVQQTQERAAVAKTKLQTAVGEYQQSQERLKVARTAVTSALAAHFDDVTAATETMIGEQLVELSSLSVKRRQLQDYRAQVAQVTTTIDDLKKRIGNRPTPDRDATKAAVTATNQQVEDFQARQHEYQDLWQQNDEHVHQITKQIDQQAVALKMTEELTELSGIVNGDGPNSKVGLERYVLQTYLRQILKVGNSRLQQLTNGRYQFVIDESSASYKKNSGLEINVYDDHVGGQRSVHTLSGGESFIASLALALALGEVIQQTTGSVDVDALFIDEGFGSLDEDALGTALESLETIEGKHRMIGIISHVSELRDQVTNQLQVVAGGNGESTIKYVSDNE
ncbi:AAA family ATPase [Levilactobacillus koreensis]|uniref:Nuclease SbcCD subunit C n=1 Tax=Levilactobacillus koreensis TaxID=637971 RepID=A0AAC9ER54_9LACO|nr:SMC family ATPase [Levilactobacillus koreensis]AKP65011.1 DNA repair ATPase [Levilactobacillus koreensis]